MTTNEDISYRAANTETVLQILRMRDFMPKLPKNAKCGYKQIGAKKRSNNNSNGNNGNSQRTMSVSDLIVQEVMNEIEKEDKRNADNEDEKAEKNMFDEQTLYNTAKNSFEYGEANNEEEVKKRVEAFKEKERRSVSTAKFNRMLESVLQRYGFK